MRNAKILLGKQKRIIKEQREIIAKLRKHEAKFADSGSSVGDVPGKQFILGQLKQHTLRKSARRYSTYDKNFALALHYCSPKCYRFLRKVFFLPTVWSLQRWLQNVNVVPCFITPVLDVLKLKSATLPPAEKLCTIAFDEMSLKQLVTYNSQCDLFEGFVVNCTSERTEKPVASSNSVTHKPNASAQCAEDSFLNLGSDLKRLPALANQAMVVLIRGIRSNFKQVIGYFLSANAMSGDELKTLVLQSIAKVQEAGFIPKVIVTDQGSNNVNMRTQLGVSESSPFVEVNGEKVYFFSMLPICLNPFEIILSSITFSSKAMTASGKTLLTFTTLIQN